MICHDLPPKNELGVAGFAMRNIQKLHVFGTILG